MDDVVCLGSRSGRATFAFSSYFSRLLAANSTQYKSFIVKLKMANSKWTYQGKTRRVSCHKKYDIEIPQSGTNRSAAPPIACKQNQQKGVQEKVSFCCRVS